MSTELSIKEQIEELNSDFITALRCYCDLHENTVARVRDYSIQVAITGTLTKNVIFGSEIELYPHKSNGLYDMKNEISIPSSGSFDMEQVGSVHKYLHTAEIIKNWVFVCDLVNEYTMMYGIIKSSK